MSGSACELMPSECGSHTAVMSVPNPAASISLATAPSTLEVSVSQSPQSMRGTIIMMLTNIARLVSSTHV